MPKNITKKCIIDEDTIIIKLEDTRDEYIYEYALGEIGTIYISKEGLLINPNFDPEYEIEQLRNQKLVKAFNEIFDATDYNPLSSKYYNKINEMIKDGTLEFLGYTIQTYEEEQAENLKRHNHR